MPAESVLTYRLEVTLLGIRPPIWRRIEVPATISLGDLHSVLQIVMGWTDSHLHQFEKDGKCWGAPEFDEFGELDLLDESRARLCDLLTAEGESLMYLYDFGDNWRHTFLLEKITPLEKGASSRPVCLAGARHCPPEDVGGPTGYQEFLDVTFDLEHKDSARFREWAGGSFHAEEFSVQAINAILNRMRWPKRHARRPR